MSEKVLTKMEIGEKIAEKTKDFLKMGEIVELEDEELDKVAGGVDSFAFEQDGYVIVAVCNNPQTLQNRDMMPALARNTVCMLAPAGTLSCYECKHFSAWRTAKTN